MRGPCLCGAYDCPRCFPSSWWHLEDCNPDEDGNCECPEPYECDLEQDPGDESIPLVLREPWRTLGRGGQRYRRDDRGRMVLVPSTAPGAPAATESGQDVDR
jgi:hypothetical protein